MNLFMPLNKSTTSNSICIVTQNRSSETYSSSTHSCFHRTLLLASNQYPMDPLFTKRLFAAHQACPTCPSPVDVIQFYKDLLAILFPETTQLAHLTEAEFFERAAALRTRLVDLIQYCPHSKQHTSAIRDAFFDAIPSIYEKLLEDVEAMFAGDPAARSKSEVIRSYPGFYAIAAYRFAHTLYDLNVDSIPRILTEHAHSVTGIDIHPGATIGSHFCIDHGTGIVIGETTTIGNHVKMYQGVTLGALSVNKEDAQKKRHPTIEDNVVIYAGASILGGDTVIGRDSIIGGNVWLTRSIPPSSKVYYQSKMYHTGTEETDLLILKAN